MSEKVESGLEVVAYADPKAFENFKAHGDLDGVYAHEWMWVKPDQGLIGLVRQSDAERALSERDAEIQRQRERHRTTWTQLEHVTGLLREARADVSSLNGMTQRGRKERVALLRNIDAVLSQQADPVLSLDDVMAAVLPDNHPMKEAPAQDEREAFEAWYERTFGARAFARNVDHSYQEPETEMLWAGWQARAARPAQTEQQPVAIPEAVKAWMMDVPLPDNEYGYRLTNRRDELLAAPIAQTEQQPEQTELVMPVALASVNSEYDRGWSDHAAEVLRLNAALSAQGESHE